MRPARPPTRLHEKFMLPAESAHYTLAIRDDIPQNYCVLGLLPTTRGSGADVQGESLKGTRAGSDGCGGEVPASLLFRFTPERMALQKPSEMEHKVPTTASVSSALHDSHYDSAPVFGRAPIVADHGLLTLLAH